MATLIVIRQRLAALSQRERVLLGIAAAGIVLLLIFLLVRGDSGAADEEGVELTTTMPPSPAITAPAPPPIVPVMSAAAPVAPPADTNALSTVILRGVSGGGPGGGAAIFALPNGAQRVVRVGREVIPGVMLQGVGIEHAIVSAGGGGMRLTLGKAGGVPVAAPPPALASTPPPAASTQSTASQAMAYRSALAPRRAGGRITGFTIRPGANLPVLARAGLQPGDVLVAVNGQAVESEEKVLELATEIATSYTAEFEFERGGQRQRRTVEINKRAQ